MGFGIHNCIIMQFVIRRTRIYVNSISIVCYCIIVYLIVMRLWNKNTLCLIINNIISGDRVIHISTEVNSILCIVVNFIIFNQYIVAIKWTNYATAIIIIYYIISNYHIMCSCMWVQTIMAAITDHIIFYNHMTYTKGIQSKINMMYIVISYNAPITTIIIA
jgi:hypothetical protein